MGYLPKSIGKNKRLVEEMAHPSDAAGEMLRELQLQEPMSPAQFLRASAIVGGSNLTPIPSEEHTV